MKTIDFKGRKYAQVKDRLAEFRSKCPQGLVETTPLPQPDGSLMFKARIVVDKSNPASAEATGHSYSKADKVEQEKGFEKLETIAVGRALALLGYASDGEIASSEEMEEFMAHQQQKREKAIANWTEQLEGAKTVEALKAAWADVPGELRKDLEGKKDEMKAILTTEAKEAKPKAEKKPKTETV